MEPLNFQQLTIELRDEIIWITFKDNAEIDVKDIKEMIKGAEQLSRKKSYVLFADARVHLSITPEARAFSADRKNSPFVVATAVVINNLATRFIANFFKNFNKPHFKFQVFNDEQKALKWLRKYKP